MKNGVEFIRHMIYAEALRVIFDKVETIVSAKEPQNIKDLCSLLGLMNYYGKFIPNLSTTVHSLKSSLWHKKKWDLTTCLHAFSEGKQALYQSLSMLTMIPFYP